MDMRKTSPSDVFDLPVAGMSHRAAGSDKTVYSPLCRCNEPKALSNNNGSTAQVNKSRVWKGS